MTNFSAARRATTTPAATGPSPATPAATSTAAPTPTGHARLASAATGHSPATSHPATNHPATINPAKARPAPGRATTALLGIVAALALLPANAALAHHPLGGETPQTLLHGLLSGLGHPVIGLDHLAFVIGIGLIAAFQANRLVTPAAFVAATIAGTLLVLGNVTLPLAEFVISASVVGIGAAIMYGRTIKPLVVTPLVALAGLFHGWAYGAAVIGAEPTPLIAYLSGFALIQFAIALGVAIGATRLWQTARNETLAPRLAGAVLAGIGFTYVFEIAEGLVF